MLAYRSWASRTSLRLPKIASASSKNSTALTPPGLGEDALRFFSGLPDVLVDHRGQVDGVEVQPEVRGDHLRRHHRLRPESPANSADTPRPQPRPVASASPRAPGHGAARGGELLEGTAYDGGQDQVVPGHLGLDPAGQALQAGGVLRRMPIRRSPAEIRPVPGAAAALGADGARWTWAGPRRGGRRASPGSMSAPGPLEVQSAAGGAARARRGTGVSTERAGCSTRAGPQVVAPHEDHGARPPGEDLDRLDVAVGQRLDRPATSPAPRIRGLPGDRADEGLGSGARATSVRSATTAPLPPPSARRPRWQRRYRPRARAGV